MNVTFQNSAQVLSIGIFFTLVIIGLSGSLPASLYQGLAAHGVPRPEAAHVAHLPPVSTLFAAFLGYSPLAHLLPATILHHMTHAQLSQVIGRRFFPSLIASPFGSGLHTAFDFAAAGCLVAAFASWARGKRYVFTDKETAQALSTRSVAKVPATAAGEVGVHASGGGPELGSSGGP